MNVALYYPWLYLRSGGERTISEIVKRSRHDWTLITNRYEAESTFPELQSARIIELPRVSVTRSFSHVARAGWQIGRQELPLDGLDALVVVCEGLGDLVTFRNSTIPVLCICLTPLRIAFDAYYRETYLAMGANTWPRRLAVDIIGRAFRFVDKLAWKRYSRVFAISTEVKNRIVAGGLRGAEDIQIAYPGIDLDFLQLSDRWSRNILLPGRIMWTKNIELGIEAFMDLVRRRPDLSDYTLTVAGFVDVKSRPYIAKLRAMAVGCPAIRFVESPSDEELFKLYRDCYAVLFTAFNEDWGIVPLEAMALGKPVVSVNRGGPTETVLHDRTGILAEPRADAFSAAIERLADAPELAREMGLAGRRRAELFQWNTFCETIDRGLDGIATPRVRTSGGRLTAPMTQA